MSFSPQLKTTDSEVLVSRPHCDTRAVALRFRHEEPGVWRENPQPSSGSAAADYLSAKYTPAEWFSNYQAILQQAAAHRTEALSVQRESRALSLDTEADAFKNQADGTRLLGQRLQEIHGWQSELRQHIERLQSDTDTLMALRTRLERALDTSHTPYAIATDNLKCRAHRPGPDLVRDSVEEELLKEVELICSVQALLKRTADQVVAQIKSNREAKQTLELDWSDKLQAYSLDELSGRHSNSSTDTQLHPSSASVQEQVCNSTSWTKFTQDNLSRATQEQRSSCSLRTLVEQVLKDTANNLRAQCSKVERAFSQRCEQLTEARSQLQKKLEEILEQIGTQERNMVALQQSIQDKEAPLRVLQSRLHLRSLRPNTELCRDQPQLSLEEESRQLDSAVASLQQQLTEARGSLSRLEESRRSLERDVDCKSHSLFIERDKCLKQRERYPTVSTLLGY